MRTISFKVNEEEEKAIRYRMHVAGETNLSAHLRRVVLSGGNENEALLGSMFYKLGKLADAVERNHRLLRQEAQKKNADIERDLLACMYLMLHGAVEPEDKAAVDEYLNVKSVWALLGKNPEDLPQKLSVKPQDEVRGNDEGSLLASWKNMLKPPKPGLEGK